MQIESGAAPAAAPKAAPAPAAPVTPPAADDVCYPKSRNLRVHVELDRFALFDSYDNAGHFGYVLSI